MFVYLNTKKTKRFSYCFSKKIKNKAHFYLLSYAILFILFSMLFSSFYFLSQIKQTVLADNNTQITEENTRIENQKIQNLVFVLNDIYKNNNFTEFELKQITKLILNNSKKYKLEPELILAIISVESSFNRHAVSPVGALGLMQLMPGTYIEVAKHLGLDYKKKDNIYEITNNINSGTYYLAKLNKKYKNNIRLAILAYNWGPGNIDRFIRNSKAVPKSYYNKVMAYYKKYTL